MTAKSTKKSSLNPKVILLEYYDSLIRQIDIYTEELLENYSELDLLEDFYVDESKLSQVNRLPPHYEIRTSSCIDTYEISSFLDPYSKDYEYGPVYQDRNVGVKLGQTRIIDYLNSIRDVMIDELQRAQDYNMQWLKLNRFEIEEMSSIDKCIDEIKSKVFAQKFCFLLRLDEIIELGRNFPKFVPNTSMFKLYLFICDFFINRDQFQVLKYI